MKAGHLLLLDSQAVGEPFKVLVRRVPVVGMISVWR